MVVEPYLSEENLVRMLQDIRETIGEEEVIVNPLGWGAAREFDRLEKLMYNYNISFPYVRYDLSEDDDMWYGVRKIKLNPHKIRKRLENGVTRLSTPDGIKLAKLDRKISFDNPRPYIIFEDWTKSGLSLMGGVFYIAYYADVFNPKSIYSCVLNDYAGISYFSAFKGFQKENKPYLGTIEFLQSLPAYNILQKRGSLRFIKDNTLDTLFLDMLKRDECGEYARV